jgi:hypothetical protein
MVDVSIYTGVIEDANRQKPLHKNFEVITSMKYFSGTMLGYVSRVPS